MRLSAYIQNTVLSTALLCVATSATADSEKPSPVTQIRAVGESGPAVVVSWNEPSDNIGVVGYNIYRDGNYYSTIHGDTSYTDRDVSSGHGYNYYIVAFDEARNYGTKGVDITAVAGGETSEEDTSIESSPAPSGGSTDVPQVTSSDKPSAPGDLAIDNIGSSAATISWSTPAGGAEGFNVYKDGSYYTTIRGSNEYTASSLTSGRSYSFEVVAFRNNLFSPKSSSVSVQIGGDSSFNPPPPSEQPTDNNDSSVPDNYILVFSDEFDHSSIDSTKWNTSYRWGSDLIINNEAQYYVNSLQNPDFGVTPFKLNSDTLTIQATRTPDWLRSAAQGQPYLSGAMTTFNKFRMTYGYVEMRAKLPRGQGLWPAFWLLHQSDHQERPEIDVVEMLGNNSRLVYQTYHYFENNSRLVSSPSYQVPGPDYANDFHTFGMLWEPGRITWYVDGKETNRHVSSGVSSEEMYILLNLALGGSWPGYPDASTPFPANFEIDYVRAYQAR